MSEKLPVSLTKRAGKELKKIRNSDKVLYGKITAAIQEICNDPLSGEAKKGDLKGYFCLDVMHRGTNYEICYAVEFDDSGEMILIVLMGPRENFYDDLKRYLGKL